MNKYFKVLFFLAFLYLLSYGLASFFTQESLPIATGETIAVIPVVGMVTLDGTSTLLSSSTAGGAIVERIESANADPHVKGIVLEINSPGGTVLGSKVVADALKEVDKPTVAVITEYGTSGAYWIASQSDVIVADELSIVGSIGVIGSYLDFSGLLEEYDIEYNRLVTGDYKDISSPYKELTYEEEKLIQERLDTIHDFFVADVAEGRSMTTEEIDALAEGLFYLGLDAKELGLVDRFGNLDDGIAIVEEMAGIENGDITEYKEEQSFFDTLRDYTAYSSFYIGQGIGSVLASGAVHDFEISAT